MRHHRLICLIVIWLGLLTSYGLAETAITSAAAEVDGIQVGDTLKAVYQAIGEPYFVESLGSEEGRTLVYLDSEKRPCTRVSLYEDTCFHISGTTVRVGSDTFAVGDSEDVVFSRLGKPFILSENSIYRTLEYALSPHIALRIAFGADDHRMRGASLEHVTRFESGRRLESDNPLYKGWLYKDSDVRRDTVGTNKR